MDLFCRETEKYSCEGTDESGVSERDEGDTGWRAEAYNI